MPVLETRSLGRITWEPESEIEFPQGLPGFEERRRFVAVHLDHTDPLLFLQSLEDPGLNFVALPVRSVDPEYRIAVSREDLELIGLPAGRQPRIGSDIHCLAVLSIRETGVTANLLAPVLINLRNLKAVQAVMQQGEYSHQHVLTAREAVAPC